MKRGRCNRGGLHSSVCVAAMEVAHDNGIPVFFAEPWNDTVTSVMHDEVFRLAPLSSEVAAVDVRFVRWLGDSAGMELEELIILTENTDFGIPVAENAARLLEEAGISSLTFSVDIGTQDFSGIVERIRAEDPDMILTYATEESAFTFNQQTADAGVGPQDGADTVQSRGPGK